LTRLSRVLLPAYRAEGTGTSPGGCRVLRAPHVRACQDDEDEDARLHLDVAAGEQERHDWGERMDLGVRKRKGAVFFF